MEFKDGSNHMRQGGLIIIPAGTLCCPMCGKFVKCLLIELEGMFNGNNTGGTHAEWYKSILRRPLIYLIGKT